MIEMVNGQWTWTFDLQTNYLLEFISRLYCKDTKASKQKMKIPKNRLKMLYCMYICQLCVFINIPFSNSLVDFSFFEFELEL